MDENKKTLSPRALPRQIGQIFEKRVGQSLSRDATSGLFAALVAFLLAGCALPFSTYPLGLALLCASTEHTLFIAVGLLAAAFTTPLSTWLSVAVILGTLLIRVAARVFVDLPTRIGGDGRRGELLEHLRGRLFCEGLYLRMACVCVSVFAMSLYAIIHGGFRYYDLFGAIFSMVAAPLSVFLLAGLFAGEYDRLFPPRFAKPLYTLSRIALAVGLCYSFLDTSLAGIPISLTLAFVAVLLICRRYGLIASALTALISGLIIGLPYPPVLLVAALAAYCILDLSPMLAASVACIAGTVCGVLTLGGGSVTSVFLPLFSGTAVYCTADKLIRSRATEPLAVAPTADSAVAQARIAAGRKQTEDVASALTELSAVFSAMSERQKHPTVGEFRELCDECFASLCPDCRAYETCRSKHRASMQDAISTLASQLSRDGQIDEEKLPATIADNCFCVGEIIRRINERAAELTKTIFCSEKAELFSLDYSASATLLRELSERLDDDFREDTKLSDAIRKRLSDIGYSASSVGVTGTRQKQLTVTGIAPIPTDANLAYLGNQLSRVCGFPWDALSLDGENTLRATRAQAFSAAYGSCLSAKENVCGDVIALFRDEERGYLYALLDDGMGTGKEAAVTAQLSSLFLRKLLPTGIRPETVLRMLNQFLRLGRNGGSTESSTTVDLLSLDLIGGRASFLKSGAAPTYVKRGKNIFYLDSKTAPVGILREIDAKQIDFEIKEGDIIVMVSDGITGGENECLWLLDYLDSTDEQDPKRLAEHIVARAAEEDEPDDLSAIVLRIDRVEEG